MLAGGFSLTSFKSSCRFLVNSLTSSRGSSKIFFDGTHSPFSSFPRSSIVYWLNKSLFMCVTISVLPSSSSISGPGFLFILFHPLHKLLEVRKTLWDLSCFLQCVCGVCFLRACSGFPNESLFFRFLGHKLGTCILASHDNLRFPELSK